MKMENEKYIENAVSSFRELLLEQIAREERMKKGSRAKKEKSTCRKIGIIGGDGIGPYIVSLAKKVLCKLLSAEISYGKVEIVDIDGLTIENRLALGVSVPSDVLEKIKECDVLLKGPTTTPKGGTMESANVTLRRELDLYANVRPVSIPNKGIDWVFFRENTEGEYVLGSRGIEIPDTLSMDFKVTTDHGTERIARAAYDYARDNGMGRVSIVTKANIMKKTDGKFSMIAHKVANDYPMIETDEWYIDIMAANLVNEEIRPGFKVFLLPNLYGDIITDEAAQIQGGVGTAGSANIGDDYAMFEAVHGSAPRLIEEGLTSHANPQSILKATEMLLRHIGYQDKAEKLCSAMSGIDPRFVPTGTSIGATADEYVDELMKLL